MPMQTKETFLNMNYGIWKLVKKKRVDNITYTKNVHCMILDMNSRHQGNNTEGCHHVLNWQVSLSDTTQ